MIIDFLPCLPDMQDEVLVTKDHPVILSVAAPKEVRKNGRHRNIPRKLTLKMKQKSRSPMLKALVKEQSGWSRTKLRKYF